MGEGCGFLKREPSLFNLRLIGRGTVKENGMKKTKSRLACRRYEQQEFNKMLKRLLEEKRQREQETLWNAIVRQMLKNKEGIDNDE